jgi:glutamyl-tRNA synthetase
MRELIDRFALEGISGGNAVFNTEKLDWFNHQHLLRLSDDELIGRLKPFFGNAVDLQALDQAWIERVLALLRPRAKRLTDYVDGAQPFLKEPAEYDPEAVKKHLMTTGLAEQMHSLRDAFAAATFDEQTLEQSLRTLADARSIKAGALIHATRIAMTGRMVSPGLFEMLVLLGRERVLARLDRLIRFLEALP